MVRLPLPDWSIIFSDTKERVKRELADAAQELEEAYNRGGGDSDTDTEDEKLRKGAGVLNELEASMYSLNASVSSLNASVVLAEVSTYIPGSSSPPLVLTNLHPSLYPHPYPSSSSPIPHTIHILTLTLPLLNLTLLHPNTHLNYPHPYPSSSSPHLHLIITSPFLTHPNPHPSSS